MEAIPVDSYTQSSFIHARDPSILAFNRPYLFNQNRLKENLFNLNNELETMGEETQRSNDENYDQLQVYLRVKPSTIFSDVYKIGSDKKSFICEQPNSQNKGTKIFKYTFSKIYGPETGQKELFDHCIKEKLLNFINGQNSTFFAYGTSGAGKTYTILGTENNPGIIPRALEYVFRSLPPMQDEVSQIKPANAADISVLTTEELQKELQFKMKVINSSLDSETSAAERTYRKMQQRLSTDPVAEITGDLNESKISIWISFYEIYNEYVYDLLCFDVKNINTQKMQRQKLQICADSSGQTYVKNLTSICVKSGIEAYKIMQFGMNNIQYGATLINDHSSRSHSIFTIKLVQYNDKRNECQISHFNFCDLAGSERAKKSNSVGSRLKESSNINHSLHVLGRCIKTIRDSSKRNEKLLIPYRESKLTRLFQPALSGKETTSMIVNLNPISDMFDENLHVLNFSSIAKHITLSNSKCNAKVPLKDRDRFGNSNGSVNIENSNELQNLLIEEVQRLEYQLEEQAREFKEKEEMLRNNYVKKMQEQLMEQNAATKKKIEETKLRCEKRFQKKLEQTENHYQLKIRMLEAATSIPNASESEIIDLTDEDIDNRLELEFENTQLKNLVEHFKEEIEYLKKKNTDDQQKISELESKLKDKNRQLTNLEYDYFESLKKNEELELELKTMKEEHLDLEEHYSQLAITQQDQVDYVEELEEQLNATKSMICDSD